jgi:hypothetical protein
VAPPFIGVAVNVTEVPAQTGLDDAAIDTPAGRFELTTIVTVLDVAGLPVVQDKVEVITTVITSPLARVDVV